MAISLAQAPTQSHARDDFLGALIGGVIGGAISGQQRSQPSTQQRSQPSTQQRATQPTAPRRSAAEVAEVRQLQEMLNYFGFPTGTPDGVIGRRTRDGISQYQIFMGYPPSGDIQPHERAFLTAAYNRALMEAPAVIQQAMINPLGMRVLLRQYTQPNPTTQPVFVAPQPTVAVVAPQAVPVAAQPEIVQPVQGSTTIVVEGMMSSEDAGALQEEVNALADQIALLRAVIEHQIIHGSMGDERGQSARIQAVERMLVSYDTRMEEIEQETSEKYTTPIRPQNQNLGQTARRLSEIFPKVPYYIAGTNEIGEMWVEPVVSDGGTLQFGFNFIDRSARYDPVRDRILFEENEILSLSEALTRVHEWTEIAQENGVRRNFARRVVCLPDDLCDNRSTGISSSEVVFQIYEDGSTAARIQRNRGTFVQGYNMSVESGLLLAAYLDYMHNAGMREFKTGSMTDDDLDALFE